MPNRHLPEQQSFIAMALAPQIAVSPERAADVPTEIVEQLRAKPHQGLVRLLLRLGEKLPSDQELEAWALRVSAKIKAMGQETVAEIVEELKAE